MTHPHGALGRQIAQAELRVGARQLRLRRAATSLIHTLRDTLTSPRMLLAAIAVGFVCERFDSAHGRARARRDRAGVRTFSLVERLVIAGAVLRRWGPLVRLLAGWVGTRPVTPSTSKAIRCAR